MHTCRLAADLHFAYFLMDLLILFLGAGGLDPAAGLQDPCACSGTRRRVQVGNMKFADIRFTRSLNALLHHVFDPPSHVLSSVTVETGDYW